MEQQYSDTLGYFGGLREGGTWGEKTSRHSTILVLNSSHKTYFLRPCVCLTHGGITGNASLERQEAVGPRSSLLTFQKTLWM